ncbi:MAG TPA: hypothetical protein VJN72_06230 [Gaiellales bacterium]|nr:hypothetical protein [Gaiellales bacterium]
MRRIEADANRSNLHAFPLPDAWGIDMYLKDRDRFTQLFHGEDAVSRVFLDVIQRRLVATLGQTLRPHARLAASL